MSDQPEILAPSARRPCVKCGAGGRQTIAVDAWHCRRWQRRWMCVDCARQGGSASSLIYRLPGKRGKR